MGSTKRARDNRRLPWSGAPDYPVCHRTVSGAPPDTVRCTRELQAKLLTFGKTQRRCAIIHRTASGVHQTVSGAPRRCDSELASFGNSLRYNSPDMSGAHRTVRCNGGATATSGKRSPAAALNARQSAQKAGTRDMAHRTLYSTCPVRHRTSRRAQQSEFQRSEP